MAFSAMGLVYGAGTDYTAATVSSYEIKGNEIFVKFRDVGDGLVCGGNTLKGFAVAGSDRIFVGADAEYKPLFCVQPMYYLLVYVANYYAWSSQQYSNAWEGFKNSLYSFLKNDKDFLAEIKKLSKNMLIDKMGYKILHANTILK